ncbi:hypothetical protein AALP_AAs67138U000100, partial [Arabis alpina]
PPQPFRKIRFLRQVQYDLKNHQNNGLKRKSANFLLLQLPWKKPRGIAEWFQAGDIVCESKWKQARLLVSASPSKTTTICL